MIQVVQSHFLSSASSIFNAPPPVDSEIVFLGRSNVGKSTLINALLNKPLAKSSSTPGKTQLINFFYSLWTLDKQPLPLTLIDLPGFGYAKVSKTLQKQWQKHLMDFLLARGSIKLFLHLLDARHTQMEIDISVGQMLERICHNDQYILRIYTKADKLKQSELNALKGHLAQDKAHRAYIFSATKTHHKMTSITQLREGIAQYVLGLSTWNL
ncbi:YihA family ribosome biogenesis GTP-binding protein [Helicobacter jaachi]|uniref:Probable GTP-binding protein EngB n=1 Tax=Helicobacter jaachi TaxID=1677920 RepID=A0A4U8TBE8_9HELI|nr:ribosome biogenesis GTP-binding protein YihA/YsxC [Helicobacter jaachi]TLD97250.1 YihA family ribosome biogenesis GTP-binding protein [Helicobacter jaachi]